MNTHLLKTLALTGLLVAVAGCSGTRYAQSTGEYIDSKTLNSRVKGALWNDPEVNGFDIDVDVWKSVVQLNGFVDTAEQKQRAEQIAWNIPGVESVRNNLTVKHTLSQRLAQEDQLTPTSRHADTPQRSQLRPEDERLAFGRISANPTEYYGTDVVVQAQVDTIFSPYAFTIKSSDGIGKRKMMVIADKQQVQKITPGDIIRIQAKPERFDLEKVEEQLQAQLEEETFRSWKNEGFLRAQSVEQASPDGATPTGREESPTRQQQQQEQDAPEPPQEEEGQSFEQ